MSGPSSKTVRTGTKRLFRLSLIAATSFLACSAGEPSRPPNIILITFDTLRADHLGCYGYGRNTSPNLDAFASSAVLHTQAVATAPWTVPTHASLFTGKHPFEHGARTFARVGDSLEVSLKPLGDEHVTLAEILRDAGYETGAFTANTAYLSPRWGLNQGFTTYYGEKVHADLMNERVVDWLGWVQRTVREPFFLFINYIDTHRPYNTSPRPGFLENPPPPDNEPLMVQLYESVMPGTGPVPRELVQDVIDQYDVAVANVDEGFGSLLERLRAMDVYDSTLIIVTSDHGEYFGEHHLVEHVKDVYQEAVRVPLIIKYPGQARARREAALVSSVDVPALILSAFPRELAGRLGQGFANSPGSHPVVSEVYYSERKDVYHPLWGSRFRRVRTALFEPPYKYIASSDGKNELYHLENDATESRNLIDEEPETARRLAGKLREFMDTGAPGAVPADPPPLTEEEKENLRSLGYSGN